MSGSGRRRDPGARAPEAFRWPAIVDGDLVERMIPLVQRAIAEASGGCDDDAETLVALSGPDVANVLLMILATIMEPAPDCATPRGTRFMAEAAARELARLIGDVRRLRSAEAGRGAGIH